MKKGIGTLGILLILGIVLVATGTLKLTGLFAAAPVTTQQQVTGSLPPTQDYICQTDGTNTLSVNTPNKLSPAASLYSPGTFLPFSTTGRTTASSAATAATVAYTDYNIPCSVENLAGTGYILSSTAGIGTLVNSAKKPYDLTQKLADTMSIPISNVTVLNIQILTSSLANATTDNARTGSSQNETSAQTMGTGDTRTRVIDIIGATANAQFGSDDLGAIWMIDTADSAVFSDKAISLSSSDIALAEITCPSRALSFSSANRCYKSGAIKTSDGLLKVTVTLSADLGNPGTSADPFVYIDDMQSFEEDGAIVEGTHTKGGTSVGVVRQQIGFDNS